MHYEDLWEQAEALSGIDKEQAAALIQKHLQLLLNDTETMREYHMGIVIFNLCAISKILNINAYTALHKTIIDKQSELLDKKL
jgi:hypothetical protein